MIRPSVVYLGGSRLQRNRANLIQTLQMMEAFRLAGLDATLYLPPWPSSLDLETRLREFGIESSLDIRSSWLLNRRWNGKPFVKLYGRRLRQAPAPCKSAPHWPPPEYRTNWKSTRRNAN